MTNITKQCQHCGKDFQAKSSVAKFCNRKCQRAAAYIRLQQTGKCCKVDGCDKAARARGMCMTHWGRDYRKTESTKYTFTCGQCGKQFTRATKQRAGAKGIFCSNECSHKSATEKALAVPRENYSNSTLNKKTKCLACGALFPYRYNKKYCSEDCVKSQIRYSPLSRAVLFGETQAGLKAIKAKTIKTETGCHEWQGRLKSGYAQVTILRKVYQVHRLVIEWSMGAPLGTQAVHHKCGNSKCVNPDHLQPVTQYDNAAEMLARNSYLKRIEELEDELRRLDPHNNLLDRISYV